MSHASKILVTDFDGTITRKDFYALAVERLLQPEDLHYWQDYRAGKITHFAALQSIFKQIRATDAELATIMDDMEPDPLFTQSLAELTSAGWKVVVASAGCGWYIDRILEKAGASLEVHSNPGTCPQGGPLLMELPTDDPFFNPETGVDKAGIVAFHQAQGSQVAYAGDGYTDLQAALLVPPSMRFARHDLAEALSARGETFQSFEWWSDVARALLQQDGKNG